MALATTLDKTQVADFYRQMQTIRIFEELSQVKYQEQKIKGFPAPVTSVRRRSRLAPSRR